MKKDDRKMLKRYRKTPSSHCDFPKCVLLGILFVCTSAFGQDDYLEKSFFLQKLRVQFTSKAFAERVALPPGGTVGELSNGLFALEFVVERREGGGTIFCAIKTYFDNSLRPSTPAQSLAGSLPMLRSPTHFFFERALDGTSGWPKWNVRDRIFSSTRESEYFRYGAFSSRDYEFNKKGVFSDFSLREFHREILPGVAYTMLAPNCLILEQLDSVKGPWKLWIPRENAKDYRKTLRMDEKDFIVFEVPPAFLEQVRPIARRVIAYNSANLGQIKPADR